MKYYLAPMEGITTYIYRNAHNKFFGGIDKYFTPFISPNKNKCFNSKERNDIIPEHNQGIVVVPQILTNSGEYFIRTSKELEAMGYNEINLNLGCPSGTVVSKCKGSGFLAKPKELNCFLEEIYVGCNADISIKTRIGIDSPEELYPLLEIYNQYPVKELIIHPRTQKDFYKNKPNLKAWEDSTKFSKHPTCYNGDIFVPNMYKEFIEKYPQTERMMFGRGVLVNPFLPCLLKGSNTIDKKVVKEFHDTILSEYEQILSGDRNVLFKMKELWFYMIHLFSECEKYEKKIKKTQSLEEYKCIVSSVFEEKNIKSYC